MYSISTRRQADGLAQGGRYHSFISSHYQLLVTQAAVQQAFSTQHFDGLNLGLPATRAHVQMFRPNAQDMSCFYAFCMF